MHHVPAPHSHWQRHQGDKRHNDLRSKHMNDSNECSFIKVNNNLREIITHIITWEKKVTALYAHCWTRTGRILAALQWRPDWLPQSGKCRCRPLSHSCSPTQLTSVPACGPQKDNQLHRTPQKTGHSQLASSWILTSCQPHKVTSGQITCSKFFHTSLEHKSLNHKFV